MLWASWTSKSDILWVHAAFLTRNKRLCAWFIDTIKIDNPFDCFFSNYLCFRDARELPWPERSLVYLDYSKCRYNVPVFTCSYTVVCFPALKWTRDLIWRFHWFSWIGYQWDMACGIDICRRCGYRTMLYCTVNLDTMGWALM